MNDASDQGDWVCFEGPYNDGRVKNFGGQVGSLSQSLSVQFSKLTVLSFLPIFKAKRSSQTTVVQCNHQVFIAAKKQTESKQQEEEENKKQQWSVVNCCGP